MKLTRKVTVEQPVDSNIETMVRFVRRLEAMGKINYQYPLTDDQLVEIAYDFWETQHGED